MPLRAWRWTERGQSFAEFALILPFLLLLVFGIFDFGRGMSANVTVTNASREGARYMAVRSSTSTSALSFVSCPGGTALAPTAPVAGSGQAAAWRQAADASLDLTRMTMVVRFYKAANDPASTGSTPDDTVTCTAGSTAPVETTPSYKPAAGDYVQFEADYSYTTATPLIHQIVAQVGINRTTTMVLE